MKGLKKISLLLAGIALMGSASSAMAVLSLPSGWYVEGNLGYANINNANFGSGTSYKTTGVGWNILGGYKFLPYLGAEFGATKYGNTNIKFAGTSVAKDTNWSWDLAMKGILPIEDSGFELLAKLGFARLHSNISATNSSFIAANGVTVNTGNRWASGAFLGLGADYYFNPNLPVILQWQRAKGNNITGNADLYSIGVSYLFG